VARPDDLRDTLVVEIAAGKLGKRSFEDYVNGARRELTRRWIQVLDSSRVSPPEAAVLVHCFDAVDRRGNEDRAVCWLFVCSADRLISFRAVGPGEQLGPRADEIRKLALAVTFDDLAGDKP